MTKLHACQTFLPYGILQCIAAKELSNTSMSQYHMILNSGFSWEVREDVGTDMNL